TRVLTTLSSELASTKIVNVGGSIGTITGDHLTVVTGQLGAPPPMIPLDLTLLVSGAAPSKHKTLHFQLVNHPQLHQLLLAFTIESAWLEKGEAAPGETLRVRVLLRPYRGPARVEETTVRVPEQVARGTTLRILVSDADLLNRASRGFAFAGAGGSPTGLDQLIALLNRERR